MRRSSCDCSVSQRFELGKLVHQLLPERHTDLDRRRQEVHERVDALVPERPALVP